MAKLAASFEKLHEDAIEMAGGLTDFGDTGYHEALDRLLDAYNTTARLNDIGAQAMGGAVLADLAGRLHEEAGFARFPQFDGADIRKPIIITGIPRSGTTFLHRLISADPATQFLPMWLACSPMPRPPDSEWSDNPFFHQAEQAVAGLGALSSEVLQIHPQGAAIADECRIIINHSFRAPSLMISSYIPEYEDWLASEDMVPAYRRYRRALGLIGAGSDYRWVLKCPSHVWALSALLEVFPDACLVITHRDPITAIPSIFNLVHSVRQHIEAGYTPHRFGRETLPIWGRAMTGFEEVRKHVDPARIVDVHSAATRADPIGTIERIYSHFDIPVTAAARAAWTAQCAQDPTGGHVAQAVRADFFGVTKDEIIAAMPEYYARATTVAEEFGGTLKVGG